MTNVLSNSASSNNFLGYLLEEDEALKAKLQGMTVSDKNNPQRPVLVWFRMPQQELRTVDYPFVMIDFLGEDIEHDREHRGVIQPSFFPYTNIPIGEFDAPVFEFPIPMTLHYQISTFARYIQHDRQMRWQLAQPDRLPPRFGFLDCQAGTCRRLDINNGPMSADMIDKDGKRIFRKIYNISVSTEISPLVDLSNTRVAEVILTLRVTN